MHCEFKMIKRYVYPNAKDATRKVRQSNMLIARCYDNLLSTTGEDAATGHCTLQSKAVQSAMQGMLHATLCSSAPPRRGQTVHLCAVPGSAIRNVTFSIRSMARILL